MRQLKSNSLLKIGEDSEKELMEGEEEDEDNGEVEDDDDDGNIDSGCDEDIPDDLEVCA